MPSSTASSATSGDGRAGERGQAAVELALSLPVVALFLLALVQLALLAHAAVLVGHAAREGAREAAVTARTERVRAAAQGATGLPAGRLTVTVGRRGRPGSRVAVTVVYRAPTDVPVVGRLLPDVRLAATTTMRVEM